ncbi:MAG: hypothetical protein ACD_75C02248G0004 [uncultured bacterium]|nr:MAG: hypothetical protein ACD_75C02248G0004 [uncultured bacterium]
MDKGSFTRDVGKKPSSAIFCIEPVDNESPGIAGGFKQFALPPVKVQIQESANRITGRNDVGGAHRHMKGPGFPGKMVSPAVVFPFVRWTAVFQQPAGQVRRLLEQRTLPRSLELFHHPQDNQGYALGISLLGHTGYPAKVHGRSLEQLYPGQTHQGEPVPPGRPQKP